MKIKVLNKKVYELIAAGEVITRPKFVVKELVENSIDAKSRFINVEIKNGGKSLIRVIDDGVGMSFEDCRIAFLRHATSKIQTEDDLKVLQTLGFRGEALASICAVSKVEVLTKQKNSEIGTHYFNFAGTEQICEKINCNNGTCITISNLFYNVPARLKFLKSDFTEANLIQDILEKLAISHSEISFSFKKNNKKIFQTTGNGNLDDCVYNVFGKEIFKTLIPVDNIFSKILVKGFVSLPTYCKSRGNLNISFVNFRYIKSKIIKNGVEQAFKGFSMVGKFPSFILFLKIPSSEIDVNVHPAKTEVNFAQESEVLKAVYLAVKKAIDRNNDIFDQFNFEKPLNKTKANVNLSDDHFFDDNKFNKNIIECNFESRVEPYNEKNDEKNKENIFDFDNLSFDYTDKNDNSENDNKSELKLKNSFENKNDLSFELKEKTQKIIEHRKNKNLELDGVFDLKLIGEVFKTYILAEYRDKFIVVDKHAAHERIIYEKLKNEINNFEKQTLLTPLNISIASISECRLILNNLKTFKYFGFEVELFGNHNFLIRTVPAILNEKNCLDIFNEIVENLKLKKFDLTPQTIEKILYTMACKAAITANENNSNEQLYEIIKKIYFDKNIRTCPHGRPVILVFSKERFDNNFKRI